MADRGKEQPSTTTSRTGTSSSRGSTSGTEDPTARGTQRFAAAIAKTSQGKGGKTGKVDKATAPSRKDGSGSPTPATPAASAQAKPAPAPRPARRVRRARLRLTHIDPWSVMKTSFLLSIAIGIVMVVAVGIVWMVLGAAGVWDSIDSAVADVTGNTGEFAIEDYLGTSRVMGLTMLLAVVDVFLITVIATLGAFLYNLAAVLLGGLEIVFAEEDR